MTFACLASMLVVSALAMGVPDAIAQDKPSEAQVQPSKQFKNWAVGCDNLRNCVALGMISETDKNAYIKVSRDGEAADEPQVAVSVYPGSDVAKPSATLVLDGARLPPDMFKASVDGDFVRLVLASEAAADFAGKLRNAKSLKVSVSDGTKTLVEEEIPLDGSAAALLYLDDTQKRLGTETALVEKGAKPAAGIPAVPAAPEIAAMKMTAIDAPLPPMPQGIVRPEDASCGVADDMAIKLSPTLTLWGACADLAAYNFDYEFWIVGDSKPKRAEFILPGRKPDGVAGALTSPSLSDDGFVLNAFSKGEGIGDCGTSSDWVWDGAGFRLLGYREMNECEGVPPDDWPVLFTARRK